MRYIYRGYLQIAALDLTRNTRPALWFITWDPTQPNASRPLAIQKDGTWYTYGWDLTKNICEIYGQHGYIRTAYTYTPYGMVTATGDTEQPIQWSSEYNDTELGLMYYNYRHYNPMDGRWLCRDFVNQNNLYSYVKSPLNEIDFLGLTNIWDYMKSLEYSPIRIDKKFSPVKANIPVPGMSKLTFSMGGSAFFKMNLKFGKNTGDFTVSAGGKVSYSLGFSTFSTDVSLLGMDFALMVGGSITGGGAFGISGKADFCSCPRKVKGKVCVSGEVSISSKLGIEAKLKAHSWLDVSIAATLNTGFTLRLEKCWGSEASGATKFELLYNTSISGSFFTNKVTANLISGSVPLPVSILPEFLQ